mmetsp:Transcript_45313/g.176056  ORF Transcript_45313/g.176056 Transcript_45313/m.176056 type:complete len:82 (-) Transcript_45313:406-651(-)
MRRWALFFQKQIIALFSGRDRLTVNCAGQPPEPVGVVEETRRKLEEVFTNTASPGAARASIVTHETRLRGLNLEKISKFKG